jgi:aryl-alcohol dehydrogenase-like predicted oxidoreductase
MKTGQTMELRRLGRNGPELSVIGFGTWAIGGPWEFGWGPVKDEQSIRAIRQGIKLGINWIDTAPAYGLGHSEEVVARALEGERKNIFLATKCGMVWDDSGRVRIHASPDSIKREIALSLRRLKTDYIDLYQIHWPDPEIPVEESWSALAELRAEGKVRYIGVCNFDAAMLLKCNKIAQVQSLQPPYSLLRRQIENDILPYCLKTGIGVVAYSPMQSGLLSGKFDINRIASDDWRRNNKYYQEPYLSRVLKFVDELKSIAQKRNAPVGQIAIEWVLHHPAVTSAIVGARSEAQIEEIAGAPRYILNEEDYAKIDILSKQF